MSEIKDCYLWTDLVDFTTNDCVRIKTILNNGNDDQATTRGGDFIIYSKTICATVLAETFKKNYIEINEDLKNRVHKLREDGDKIICTLVKAIHKESSSMGNSILFEVHLNHVTQNHLWKMWSSYKANQI